MGVFVFDVRVQRGIGAVGLAAALSAKILLDNLVIPAPMYFLHIKYHLIMKINQTNQFKRHHPRTIVYRPFSQEMAR